MIDFKTIENQFHVNGADNELNRILKIISDWLPFDIENGFKTSEFIFYKPVYPHISENFSKVADLLREYDIKFSAYSACVKDKDGEPVLFYKLIIHLREEKL